MIVIYDEDSRKVLDIIEDAQNVRKTETGIEWQTGRIDDLKKPFAIFPEGAKVEIGCALPDIAREEIPLTPSVEERLQAAEDLINSLLGL